ncbi:NIPSNAP family protein [Algoriphagus sp. CAU 1675]|uniref:NIPSNAP family protein n=1 Tax=Algoriphagus sp. CAU 1675 TaxID=3032597 RepID=UPI0023DA5CD4|nr:NIPSNAP family protein [Algoriphagus sp. CAU 1675]MDF2156257.1 NIPSNAP family protein [Algoriphagus sp. CAU 1675]
MKAKTFLSAFLLAFSFLMTSHLFAQKANRDIYELRIYHIETAAQEAVLDEYLENAYLPAMHRNGIKKVGVFKPLASQPDAGQKVYVFIPHKSLNEFLSLEGKLLKDQTYLKDGDAYINAAHDNPPYKRIETALLQAFKAWPAFTEPKLTGPKKDRVYELRSYEGATERLYRQKVKMFNEGETDIFTKLDFNPVFYAETLAGATMPNLVYMTTFSDMESRDAHWKAFGADPDWKRMSGMEEYKNTVSRNDTRFLYPTDYSDF